MLSSLYQEVTSPENSSLVKSVALFGVSAPDEGEEEIAGLVG